MATELKSAVGSPRSCERFSLSAGERARVRRIQPTKIQHWQKKHKLMESNIADVVFIFVLAIFVGIEVISKVPSMLHTPLMSGTNAIHGIILFGGILVLAK